MALKQVWLGSVGPFEYDDTEDYADLDSDPPEPPVGTLKGLWTTGVVLCENTITCDRLETDILVAAAMQVLGTLGADSIINGTFDVDANWTKGAGWTIAGGVAVATAATGALTQAVTTVQANKWHKLTFDATVASGSYRWSAGAEYDLVRTTGGVGLVWYFKAATTSAISVTGTSAFTGTIDNVMLQEVDDVSLYDEVVIGNTLGAPVLFTGGLNVNNRFVLDNGGHLIMSGSYSTPDPTYMLIVKGSAGVNGVYITATDKYAIQATNSSSTITAYFYNTGTAAAFGAAVGRTINNTVEDAIYFLKYVTSGVGAVGLGVGIRFDLEDAGGANDQAGRIAAVWTDVTAGAEVSDIVLSPRKSTGIAEVMRVTGTGRVGINRSPGYSLDVEGSFRIYRTGSDAYMYFVAATHAAYIYIERPVGQYGLFVFRTGTSNRWTLGVSNAAEAGGNAGSDFQLNRYSDAGGWLANALGISRATGDVSIPAVLNASRFVSNVATGTQPYVCTSTTVNTNLNADMLDGKHWSDLTGGKYVYGDGSDGTVTLAVDTVLSRDMYYGALTVNAGVHLDTNGWRVFVLNTLTNNGHIHVDGNAGSAGVNGGIGTTQAHGDGGAGGAARTANSIPGSLAGAIGGAGGDGSVGSGAGSDGFVSPAGNAETASIGGVAGPDGINGADGGSTTSYVGGIGGPGGLGGTVTQLGERMRNGVELVLWKVWHGATMYSPGYNAGSGGSGGGGGGAGENPGDTGGGGAGGGGDGGNGGCMLLVARTIVNSGTISAVGGAGGNGGVGGNAVGTECGGGGGGTGGIGGSGGVVVVITQALTGNNPVVTGGSGGNGGNGGMGQGAGASGANGDAGGSGNDGAYILLAG